MLSLPGSSPKELYLFLCHFTSYFIRSFFFLLVLCIVIRVHGGVANKIKQTTHKKKNNNSYSYFSYFKISGYFLFCRCVPELMFLFLIFENFVAVDGSGAGSGNLEILVNGGHVTSFVRNLGNQRFLASFVPHEALSHLVEMKFNGEAVPGKFTL